MASALTLPFSATKKMVTSFLLRTSLRCKEGITSSMLRTLAFSPIGTLASRRPENYVRYGETVVFCGMWRAETLEAWSRRLTISPKRKSQQVPPGHLFVIEADPKNCEILTYEAKRRLLKNVTIINCALWSQKDTLNLDLKKRSDSNVIKESNVVGTVHDLEDPEFSNGTIQIQANSIDNILNEYNIRKVDHFHLTIGGSEVEALKGMKNTFHKKNFRLFVKSITSYKQSGKLLVDDIESIIKDAGMHYYCVRRGGKKKIIYAQFL